VVAVKGLEKFSPKDFPGFIASTVFLGGCNFRCPYCHNAELVLRPERLADIPMDFFLAYLDSRKGWLEGICVTGGEPLLAEEIESFLTIIKQRGLLIKLDTNGSRPDTLERLLRADLVDRAAMDIKAPLDRYREVTGAKVDTGDIVRSAEILRASDRPVLFRTTVVPGLIGVEDIEAIGRWLRGAEVFQVQQFSPVGTLDAEYGRIKPYGRDEVRRLADAARPFFGEVLIEGA
jgi:pyruvate formate lyase activating enzyme